MRFSTYKLQTFLRLKRDCKLCDSWEHENFGYWGDAPKWAEDALERVSDTITEWDSYFEGMDCYEKGYLQLYSFDPISLDEGIESLYTFCKLDSDYYKDLWKIKNKCRKRGIVYENI